MVILLGPRLGKYNADGSSNAIPGHNLTLAAIGVFLLWFGWFGFNGGSVGDGKLFVYQLSKVVRVRTGECDNDAL